MIAIVDELHDINLLNDALNGIRKRVIFTSEHEALTVALWICTTHIVSVLSHCPVLFIHSPVPGCGKTTLLKVIKALCPFGIITSDATVPGTARLVNEKPNVTILLDEADGSPGFSQVPNVINSGFEHDIVRLVTNMEIGRSEIHSTFCPKAIARIAGGPGLPPATMSRTIPVCLHRSKPGQKVERLPKDRSIPQESPHFEFLYGSRGCYGWARRRR